MKNTSLDIDSALSFRNTQDTTIQHLSDRLIKKIFFYLSKKDFFSLGTTCKRFYNLSNFLEPIKSESSSLPHSHDLSLGVKDPTVLECFSKDEMSPNRCQDYLKYLMERITVECCLSQRALGCEDPLKSKAYLSLQEGFTRAIDESSKLKLFFDEDCCRIVRDGFLKLAMDPLVEVQNISSAPLKGHFYQIEDTEGKVRGYLLGTVHVMHGSIRGMNEKINQAISNASHLFLEVKEWGSGDALEEDLDKRIDQLLEKISEKQAKKALLAYASILSTHQLEEKISKLSPLEALKGCYKEYLYVSAQKIGMIDDKNSIIHGIDGWLHHQFSKNGRKIFGLESIEEHFKVSHEVFSDPLVQNMMIKSILEPNLEQVEQSALHMSNKWRGGEINVPPPHQEGTKEYRHIEGRSEHFGEVIYRDIMETEQIGFYGFGELHLYDSKGVIKSLQERNLKVIRIM